MGSDLVLVKTQEKAVMWRGIFKVPVNGQDLRVTIKLSKWMNPDKRTRFKCHDKFSNVDSLGFCELCHITARRLRE
ncbi:MAG: hypothetical protein A2X05_18970 [Bacteroidetes bacterium GWE2_41_25]|nr:MAG: hypothetical protein A2X03_07085 [Bacteroidetes bacterium GWA2_40_15]OFY09493.1 MAG: hypothetical protein A2X05_18970 [Bacteroidetes bacterium GWE2_41_25]